jgi:ribonuclease Y
MPLGITIELLVIGFAVLLISNYLVFYVTRRVTKSNSHLFIKQAKTKAKSIEREAEYILKDAKIKAKEYELQHRQEFDKKLLDLESEATEKLRLMRDEEKELQRERTTIKRLKDEYETKVREAYKTIEKSAGIRVDEAKELLFKRIEEEEQGNILKIVRKYESQAKEEAEKRANYIIAQATTRFAGEFTAERLINTVKLQSDDIKGRIIGKEGRNIKRLEAILGVDIIVDGTPRTITLSSFNLYRRAIAVKTIERLIDDGRIQPARIEEIYEKVVKDFDKELQSDGENVVVELGIGNVHPEILRLIGKLKYRASYGQNALSHSIEVAYLAGIMTAEIGGDEILARRAGLLHDIGKALTHEGGGNHVELGAELCKKYNESEVVINAIYAHHEYEEAETIEVATVCAADKLSAGRPGARREVLENSLKRIKKIEEIALSYNGVETAYAVNAGRELRVIVNAGLLSDDESYKISKRIARDIEKKLDKFPGDILVNVIREKRAKSLARSL